MTEKQKKLLRWSVLILALIFIGAGIMRSEHNMVFLKAVNICLECIGIG